jgi:hypothetical protein
MMVTPGRGTFSASVTVPDMDIAGCSPKARTKIFDNNKINITGFKFFIDGFIKITHKKITDLDDFTTALF